MCGIAGGQAPAADVEAALDTIAYRGPDARGVVEAGGWTLGHVRLAILDLDRRSDQPFAHGRTTLAFNGEVWNYRTLRSELETLGRHFATEGDTEVLAAALDEWGEGALLRVNAMLAAAWVRGDELCLARDRFGEVPLHFGWGRGNRFLFASEVKALVRLGADPATVAWVPPASWVKVRGRRAEAGAYHRLDLSPLPDTLAESAPRVRELLAEGCRQRSMADVPVAVLLSGGIDSSAVAALLRPYVPRLRAYTAVYDRGSRDLRVAREVADFLGLELAEVPVPAPSAADLAETVRVIEHPSKAQTEIAWACLHLARRLHADGVKVVFSGEGSDELWASYGRSYFGVRRLGWHRYRAETFLGQHRKNFARCNKAFARHAVECRLPFLHPPLVEYGVRLAREAVTGPGRVAREKGHLRAGFADLLPRSVINRPKEAFQTGAGLDVAAARAVDDPQRFYRLEFSKSFPGVRV